MAESKVSVSDIIQAKKEGRRLVMVTAYDYPFGLMADEAGVDMALVGTRWAWWCWGWTARCR
jgi:3-methyl-2-oxobutanoate hydroxymethyltransferase